jgi:hypothetical protein
MKENSEAFWADNLEDSEKTRNASEEIKKK